MGAPLKFELFADCAEQGGGGSGAQVRLEGKKSMLMVEGLSLVSTPVNVAAPENVKLPTSVGNEPVTVSVNVPESGTVKGIDPTRGSPLEPGETSIA